MHWTFRDDKTRVPQPDEYFGFVYVISNKLTTKQYIGCKQYWQMRKRKKHKPSNWRVYTSSSKELNEDIDKLGKRRFKFEIIQEYKTKRGLHYYEQYYQMKHHVLTAVIEGTDEPAYYNKNVGGIRFYVPLEKYEDPEFIKRRAEINYQTFGKGPYRITFETGKTITINSLNGWAKENNYKNPMLFDMLHNKERRRNKGNTKVYPRKRHKDIIKVERLRDEEEK
jgi:hypothetical protein